MVPPIFLCCIPYKVGYPPEARCNLPVGICMVYRFVPLFCSPTRYKYSLSAATQPTLITFGGLGSAPTKPLRRSASQLRLWGDARESLGNARSAKRPKQKLQGGWWVGALSRWYWCSLTALGPKLQRLGVPAGNASDSEYRLAGEAAVNRF